MNQMLTFDDGTILLNSEVILGGRNLWVYVRSEITFTQLFELLNNPAKTRKVQSARYGEMEEYDGYTDLFVIRKEDGGWFSAGLRKPEN